MKKESLVLEKVAENGAVILGKNVHSFKEEFKKEQAIDLSSDKLAAMRRPLVQLALQVRDTSGDTAPVTVEMSKSELDGLIAALEHTDAALRKVDL